MTTPAETFLPAFLYHFTSAVALVDRTPAHASPALRFRLPTPTPTPAPPQDAASPLLARSAMSAASGPAARCRLVAAVSSSCPAVCAAAARSAVRSAAVRGAGARRTPPGLAARVLLALGILASPLLRSCLSAPCSGTPRLASARRSPAPPVLVASLLARRCGPASMPVLASPALAIPGVAAGRSRPCSPQRRVVSRRRYRRRPLAALCRPCLLARAAAAAAAVHGLLAAGPSMAPEARILLASPLRGSRRPSGAGRRPFGAPGSPWASPASPAIRRDNRRVHRLSRRSHRPTRHQPCTPPAGAHAIRPTPPTDEATDASDATTEAFDPTVCDRPRREAGPRLLPLTTREANPPLDSFDASPYPFPRSLQLLTGPFDRKDATP